MDVLEHLDRDLDAVCEIRRVLRPGGYLLLSVPAYPALWCDHDVALHHRRRYTRATAGALLDRAGLQTIHLGHGYASVLIPALCVRLLRRRFPPRSPRADIGVVGFPLNQILTGVMWLETLVAQWLPLPCGTSILAVARRLDGEAGE